MNKLENEIEQLRKQMVQLAEELGMNHPDVHACSRRLDALLLEWHRRQDDMIKEGHRGKFYRIGQLHSCIRERNMAVSYV